MLFSTFKQPVRNLVTTAYNAYNNDWLLGFVQKVYSKQVNFLGVSLTDYSSS